MGTARRMGALVLAAALALARAGARPGPATLADVKAELTVLNGQIEQLRNELVRTGAAGGLPTEAATGLARLDQLEAELRRLTDRVDVLTNDVIRITEDASNRVGDIEFRLTELEGGDTASSPRRAARRRGDPARAAAGVGGGGAGGRRGAGGDRAVGFDAAVAAADAGDNARAAELFAAFLTTYPGGPLSTAAQYRRGERWRRR